MSQTDSSAEVLAAAHAARRRRDWPRAYELYRAAREAGRLSAEDLDGLSDVSWWLGRIDDVIAAGEAAFRAYLEEDRRRDAVRLLVAVEPDQLDTVRRIVRETGGTLA